MKMVTGLALAMLSVPAAAAEAFLGLAAHNVDLGLTKCCFERGTDVQFGVRSAPFARLLGANLRGHLLGSVNTRGGVDYAAAGVSLRFALPFGLYLAPGLGAAVHDGSGAKFQRRPDRLYLGSRILFEPELSLGAHLAGPLGVEINYVHLSHAQLAGKQNPGLETLGLRAVVQF